MSAPSAPNVRERYHDLVRADVIPFVPKAGGILVDIGGGVGATAARLKALGHAHKVGVVDLVGDATLPEIDFSYGGNLEDPAFVDEVIKREGPFQTILCLDVLEHLVDPWALVSRLHKGLSPGGTIVASIPNVRNYQALFPLLFRNKWTLADSGILDRTHLRFFVKDTAVELMTSSGLTLDLVMPKPNASLRTRLARRLTLGLFDSFITFQYIVRVRRPD